MLPFLGSSGSVTIECEYLKDTSWQAVGSVYYCDVQNELKIFSPKSAIIDGAVGSHKGGRNNDDVLGFWSWNKNIKLFPRELDKVFKNLKAITIRNGVIREIHQRDLKPFSHLEYLDLTDNDIEIIEEGLFNYNPDLAVIWISSNKIHQIHSNVFDNLNKLIHLYLDDNNCIDMNAENDSSAVREVIKIIQQNC